MIDHLSIGVKDIARTKAFYDAALKPLGYTCLSKSDTSLGYGGKNVVLWISKTAHPVAPDPRSGLHFCFKADGAKAVDAFHKAALKAGGKDNGEPGERVDYGAGYYAAFVLDPDGYRLEAHAHVKG